jgi:hypothetical protein
MATADAATRHTRGFMPTIVGLLLSATLVGCSNDDPEVCASVDELQASWNDLKDVDLSGGADRVRTAVDEVRADLAEVVDDAGDELAPEVTQLRTAAEQLELRAQAAVDDPSADTLSALGTAVTEFGTYVENLVDAVADTC